MLLGKVNMIQGIGAIFGDNTIRCTVLAVLETYIGLKTFLRCESLASCLASHHIRQLRRQTFASWNKNNYTAFYKPPLSSPISSATHRLLRKGLSGNPLWPAPFSGGGRKDWERGPAALAVRPNRMAGALLFYFSNM
jgi:hypothetical protein